MLYYLRNIVKMIKENEMGGPLDIEMHTTLRSRNLKDRDP
jgi:hypothetical protein